MNVVEAIDILWDSVQQGDYFPEALKGKMTLDEAYQAQLGVLARHVAAGEQHAGWKIALSGDATRQAMGIDTPAFGYLLASGHYQNGLTLQLDSILNPCIESELCLTLGKSLQGPGVTRDQVLDAVGQVAPAFEIVSLRGNLASDLPLGVADNIAQWGFVTGDAVVPYPKELDLANMTVEIKKNGAVEAQVRGGDTLDDQLDSIAWLANQLAKYGRAVEAGHHIMSGAFVKPLPLTQGDRWETHFSSVGTISASFT
jgi:2-keto-4-pentenoate hydratase